MVKIANIGERLIHEHEIIEKAVIEYIKMVYREYSKDPLKYEKYVNKVFDNIKEYLFPHIGFEEDEVFPLLKDSPIVGELLEEHREYLSILEKARKEEKMARKIWILEKLAEKLHEHVKKENEELLPLLQLLSKT